MGEFNKSKYNNEFTKENYDRLNIQVPKGQKAVIDEHAKFNGFKSLNAYVNQLIKEDMQGHVERGCNAGYIIEDKIRRIEKGTQRAFDRMEVIAILEELLEQIDQDEEEEEDF